MTISFVLPFVNLTGGVRLVLDYAHWLHAAGHCVTVIYPLWPYRFHFGLRSQFAGFKKAWRLPPEVTWHQGAYRLLRVPVIANRFLPPADIVVATSWPVVHDVAGLDPSRGRKVHLLFHHESATGPEARVRATYALPFHRIAFAESIRQFMAEQFDCEVHDVVSGAVNRAQFFPDGRRATDAALMLYHDDARKGAADGLAALRQLTIRLPQIRIRLCGTVRPASLPPAVDFEFHPGDGELRKWYSTSTVFLYPSRHEGFGLPPLEAMACDCPTVTTRVGAVPEYAVHRVNAWVVAPGDVDAMTDGLATLLTDHSLATRLSAAGRSAAARYDLEVQAPIFERALQRVTLQPL